MNPIQQQNDWLGQKMADMSEEMLSSLFKEITEFRDTGLLKGGNVRGLEKEFSDNVSHTPYGNCMRLVEYQILYEMSRRYYNSLFF